MENIYQQYKKAVNNNMALLQILYTTCIAGSLCYCLPGNKSDEAIYQYIRAKTIT